jgi:hypothetical protein
VESKRYTQSQVLHGLREAWESATGVHGEFDADTEIYSYMDEDGSGDDLDFHDVLLDIEVFFGFTCREAEWRDFFLLDMATENPEGWLSSVGGRRTFGSLADFIAERAPVIASFDPVYVLGRSCATAGIFTGIEQVAKTCPGWKSPFGPSTRIIEVMRGSTLDEFWTRLRWLTESAIPELPKPWRDSTDFAVCLGILTVIGGLIIAWLSSSPIWIAVGLASAMLLCAAACLYKQAVNPIPRNIVSFRDLSVLIAKSRK